MIPAIEYQRRRERLMTEAGAQSMILLNASTERLRNGDAHFPFRQDSDFLYLTGFDEPDCVLALLPGRASGEQLLFLRPNNPEREQWDGPRLGLDGAREQLGMDDAFPIEDLDDILPGLMEGVDRVYCLVGKDAAFDQRVIGWRNRLREKNKGQRGGPVELIALEHLLHEQRLIKTRDEIKAMQKAARISAGAMRRAMTSTRPGMTEAEVQAELMHEYLRHACPPAYNPIVAGGRNALVLHYIRNDQPLPDDGLLLIDAGCEYQGYAADISRTFPVNGRFSAAQKACYEVVLAAQKAAIEQVRAGVPYQDYHDTAVRVLTEGMVDLGLLSGDVDGLIESQKYRRFYMHKTGHWLGLDVHDVGDYRIDGQWRLLEHNMVVTVEPGLYIGFDEDIPEALRGIGIRIEDDIRVGRDGPENLTAAVPREVDDIEALMSA